MAKRKKSNPKRRGRPERRFSVHGVRRDPPDMRKLGRALLSLAQAEAEREAQAQHEREQTETEAALSDGAEGGEGMRHERPDS